MCYREDQWATSLKRGKVKFRVKGFDLNSTRGYFPNVM